MSNIELHSGQNDLALEMDYARAVSTAAMLPDNYRGKPADIMLAVGLGRSMGLSPAESLYRISVIKGKPTASAELIAANVRKAGHKLRVRTDEAAMSVTAQIVRADDPDFPFEVTRDIAWAKSMKLDQGDNYRKQPLTMLQWRAITAVARLACPEALYGVAYSSDEMYDGAPETQRAGGSRLGAALAPQNPGVEVAATGPKDVTPNADAPNSSADAPASTPDLTDATVMLNPSSKLARAMFAALGDAGVKEKDERLAFCSEIVGREIATSSDLTEDEAQEITDAANRYATTLVSES